MSDTDSKVKHIVTVEATVIRANGTVEELGVICRTETPAQEDAIDTLSEDEELKDLI